MVPRPPLIAPPTKPSTWSISRWTAWKRPITNGSWKAKSNPATKTPPAHTPAGGCIYRHEPALADRCEVVAIMPNDQSERYVSTGPVGYGIWWLSRYLPAGVRTPVHSVGRPQHIYGNGRACRRVFHTRRHIPHTRCDMLLTLPSRWPGYCRCAD